MPKGVYTRRVAPIIDRYWKQVKRKRGCWNWAGTKHTDGYGTIHVRRRTEGTHIVLYAHRVSWEIHYGPIPKGLFVLHKCDNPPCSNPKHLFLGTNLDNMRDCSRKGRQNGIAKSLPGVKNGNAKLTWEGVRDIRSSNESGTKLAIKYNVTKSAISKIRQNHAWKE